jgi:hypothetical protein
MLIIREMKYFIKIFILFNIFNLLNYIMNLFIKYTGYCEDHPKVSKKNELYKYNVYNN